MSPVTSITGSGLTLAVTGMPEGTLFGTAALRAFTVRVLNWLKDDQQRSYLPAVVQDTDTHTSFTVSFYPDDSGSTAIADTSTPGYEDLLSGLTLTLRGENGAALPPIAGGQLFSFSARGRTGYFTVGYLVRSSAAKHRSHPAEPGLPTGERVAARAFGAGLSRGSPGGALPDALWGR